MIDRALRMACWSYDRTEALSSGLVKPEGIDLKVENLWIQEIFYRMLTKKEFDLSELSFGAYVTSLFQENPPFVAIPVFTSRMFRHGSIYVNKDSGVESPADLKGKKIGLPEFRQTAVVWIKGIMKEEYGVNYEDVEFYTGPLEKPGGKFFFDLSRTDSTRLYKNLSVSPIPEGKTLSGMLQDKELDALYSALVPSTYKEGDVRVEKLFKESKKAEMDYFRKTSIFPIMHVLVIKKELYENDRWIASSLYNAFVESKNMVTNELKNATGALKYSLPWLRDYVDETLSLMGNDYWPYGLSENHHTLSKFLEYMFDQGVIPRLLKPRELFVEESWET